MLIEVYTLVVKRTGMEKKVFKIFAGVWLFFTMGLVTPEFVSCEPEGVAKAVLEPGDRLPRILFPNSLTTEENKYLGIGKKKSFSFDDIKARLILIDYINTNCPNCIKSIPTFVEICQMIEHDPVLKTRVKILAIAAGDTATEVKAFKDGYGVPYPILSDKDYKAHDAVGAPRVPFLIVARKDPQGKWIVVDSKVGLMGSMEYRSITYLEEDWVVSKAQGGIFSVEDFVTELKGILNPNPKDPKSKKSSR